MLVPGLLQWSGKNWPYAADSAGRWRGSLALGPLSQVHVYEAVGTAREVWMDALKSKIADYLNDHPKELSESGDHVDMSLFMMGKAKERTKPMIMIVSNDKAVRTEVVKLIRESGIVKDYPGFGVSHMDLRAEFEFLQPLGWLQKSDSWSEHRNDHEVFLTHSESWSRLSSKSSNEWRTATAGGMLTWGEDFLLHTASHFLNSLPSHAAISTSVGSLNDHPEIDLEDMDDILNDMDHSGNLDDLIEITSRGSVSPPSLMFSDPSETDTESLPTEDDFGIQLTVTEALTDDGSADSDETSVGLYSSSWRTSKRRKRIGKEKGTDYNAARRTSICRTTGGSELLLAPAVYEGAGLQKAPHSHSESLGKVVWDCREFDSALIPVRPTILGHKSNNPLLPLSNYHDHVEHEPRDGAVLIGNASGEFVKGVLSGSSSYMRLPYTTTFQETFTATVCPPLVAGDSGCWVRDEASGKLYGHVVAGSPKTGLAVIIPARNMLPAAALGMLLVGRPDIDSWDTDGWTCLCKTAAEGYVDMVCVLLKKGADAHKRNIQGETPISLAVEAGHEAVVELLLSHGAHVSAFDEYLDKLLQVARAKGHEGISNLLLSHGALDDQLCTLLDPVYSNDQSSDASQDLLLLDEPYASACEASTLHSNASILGADSSASTMFSAIDFSEEELTRIEPPRLHYSENTGEQRSRSRKRNYILMWDCHRCGGLGYTAAIHAACIGCGHGRCESCCIYWCMQHSRY